MEMWRKVHVDSVLRREVTKRRTLVVVTALAALVAGCLPSTPPAPVSVVVRSVDTATLPPSPTATASITPSPTLTLVPPTETPTDTGLRTKTPGPTATATETSTPTATGTRRPPPRPTLTPSATPGGARAAIGPAPDTSAYGVAATFMLEGRSRTFKANQKIWFRFSIKNISDSRLDYGFIGVVVSNGHFHTSWSGASIDSQGTLNWRDWVSVPEPGDYTITLSMCFSSKVECHGGGVWTNLSAPVPVTIQQ